MLNKTIKALRKSKGLSQQELAVKVNVVRQTISKWETDKAEPGVDNLKALADLYEVTLDQLTGELGRGRIPKSRMSKHLLTNTGPWLSFAWQFGWRWQRQVNCMEASLSRSLPLRERWALRRFF